MSQDLKIIPAGEDRKLVVDGATGEWLLELRKVGETLEVSKLSERVEVRHAH